MRISGEKVWRMPLVADYEDKVGSKIADGDNAAGGAGAITAALFLQHFAGGRARGATSTSPRLRRRRSTGTSGRLAPAASALDCC